jgi:hypothetical protein
MLIRYPDWLDARLAHITDLLRHLTALSRSNVFEFGQPVRSLDQDVHTKWRRKTRHKAQDTMLIRYPD